MNFMPATTSWISDLTDPSLYFMAYSLKAQAIFDMNAFLNQLQQRNSSPANRLAEPAPDDQQIAEILRCAVAAPDHARLRPWRFIVIRGSARNALGDVFAEIALSKDPDSTEDNLQRLREKPLRAPLIITVVTRLTSGHPKTPEVEQILSTGAAVQQLLLGANALGFGAVWLTGSNAYDPRVKSALSLDSNEDVAGFIYIGTESGATNGTPTITKARPEIANHLSEWHGT